MSASQERQCLISYAQMFVRFYIQSPTLLVSKYLLVRNDWKSYNVLLSVWRGNIADRSSPTIWVVHCEFLANQITYNFKDYIISKLKD